MGEGVTALAGKTSIDERRSLGRNSALTEVPVQSISEPFGTARPGPNSDAVAQGANRDWEVTGSALARTGQPKRLRATPRALGRVGGGTRALTGRQRGRRCGTGVDICL